LKIIKHRVNNIDDLILTPTNFGVEIDIRTNGSELIINHDPFESGTVFSDWLENYSHNFLVINVKEDGLEAFVLDLLKKHNVKEFFFLDQPIPSLFKSSKLWPKFCCARVSDIESIDTVLNLNVGWAWFDSLNGDWSYMDMAFKKLSGLNVKKCLVSPELHRLDSDSEVLNLKRLIVDLEIEFDAVCTKFPESWEALHSL
jgi:hypothetical protein